MDGCYLLLGKHSISSVLNTSTRVCLNARSIVNKKNELNIMVEDIDPHIIGIIESWANIDITDAELGLTGYVMFRKDRIGRRGGGVILYVKEYIQADEIKLEREADCDEAVWCKIVSGNSKLTVGLVYRCPNINEEDNIKIKNAIKEVSKGECIIMGDFNHGHIQWNSLESTGIEDQQFLLNESKALLSVIDCTEKKNAWFVTLKVKRTRLRFKIDTGADVTIITKKTWLAMKDKPRLEPTAVRLNSVGGQLKACGQLLAITKHKNTVYRFNIIVIEGQNAINLLSRDVATDMELVCRLEQINASDTDTGIGLMKTDSVVIKLKAGAQPLCITTARHVLFPLMGAVKAELDRMVTSGVSCLM